MKSLALTRIEACHFLLPSLSPPPPIERASLTEGPGAKRLKLSSDSDNSDEEEDEVVVAEGVPVISSAGEAKPVVGGPEAELKAAQLRANKPLEERQQEFKAMLLERGVSGWILVCFVCLFV